MRIQFFAAVLAAVIVGSTVSGDVVSDIDPEQFSSNLDTVLPEGVTSGKLLKDSADFQQAIAAFRQGRFDTALESLEKTSKSYTRLPPPKVMLAILLLEVRRNADARNVLEQAHMDAGNDPTLYRVFGDLARAEGRLTDAYVHYEKAWRLARDAKWTDKQKNHFRRYCVLGMSSVHEARGEWDTAQRYLEEALKIESDDVEARRRLALALFSVGDSAGAYQQLQSSIEANSELEPAEIFMARFAGSAGKDKETEGWLKQAIKNHPEDTRGLILYASWLLDQGRAEEAWTHAANAAKLDPESNDTLLLLGMVARFLKQDGRAEQYFERIHRDQPANFQASNQLAHVLVEQDDDTKKQRALQLAQVNVRQYPQLIEALSTLGWVYFQNGRIDEAEQALAKAMSAGRSNSDTAYYMARVLAQRGRTEDAKKLLTGALEATGRFIHRADASRWLKQLNTLNPPDSGTQNG